MNYLSIFVPGPWWTPLTYACRELPSPAPLPGSRVVVPLGKSQRVGFFLSREAASRKSSSEKYTLREAGEFLETAPAMGKELWELSLWISRRYLCSPGMALKAILPEEILKGKPVEPTPENPLKVLRNPSYSCIYQGRDSLRYEMYAKILEETPSCPRGLFVFPEIAQARSFWLYLRERGLQNQGALWDISGKAKKEAQFLLWQDLRKGNISFLVGSLGSIFAPLPKINFIVIDQEESGAYEYRRPPFFHARSILAKRGDFFSSHIYFGGRMPSSRVFLQLHPVFKDPPKGSFVFTHTAQGISLALDGTEREIPLAKKLLEESVEAQKKGEGVLWIFDRTDENRELFCDDCGHVFICPLCGSMLEMGKTGLFRCSRCGNTQAAQSCCPHCRGEIFSYRGAGLRGFHAKLQSLLGQGIPCFLFDRKRRQGGLPLEKIRASGGIILGTRKALSLCDTLSVSLIAWLDADAEARRSAYNSREKAFRMIWESCWRGTEKAPSRRIFLQSRNPQKGWQGALEKGWEKFWAEELRERELFSFPPYGTLIEVSASPKMLTLLAKELEELGIPFSLFPGTQENPEETLWIKCAKTSSVFETIRKIFNIQNPHVKRKQACTLRIWRD